MLHLVRISRDRAAEACAQWHYSRSLPAVIVAAFGVWEDEQYIGAVCFGVTNNPNSGSRVDMLTLEVAELVRVALSGHQAPVSRIVAIATRLFGKQCPRYKMLVSYADPVQGHHGGIYQAMGWLYAGRSKAQRELLMDGQPLHKRTASSRWGTASVSKLIALTGRHVERGPVLWKHTYYLPLCAEARL